MASSSTAALLASSTLIKQGAEAKVYTCFLHPHSTPSIGLNALNIEPDGEVAAMAPTILKHRFSKQYRHPNLDSSLTRARIAGEARALMKCLRCGVNVPAIRMVDAAEGVIGIEWIDGQNVRTLLGGTNEGEIEADNDYDELGEEADVDDAGLLVEYGITKEDLMSKIGVEIGKMHMVDIIHGDLTTSNMMLRRPTSTQTSDQPAPLKASASLTSSANALVLIDFGLSYTSALAEDKAVDLYVLERAFASTHPDSEPLFTAVLKAYERKVGAKAWKVVGKRLDEVRLRGRKRSMVG